MIDKFIFAGLIFLIVFTPLAFGTTGSWAQGVMEFTILVLLLLYAIKAVRQHEVRIENLIVLSAFALFGLFVLIQTLPIRYLLAISFKHAAAGVESFRVPHPLTTLSLYPNATLAALIKLAIYGGLFFLIGQYFSSRKGSASAEEPHQALGTARGLPRTPTVFHLIGVIIFFAFGLSVFAIIQHMTFNDKIYWVRELTHGGSPFGPFVNRNHYAGYMELTIPLALGFVFAKGFQSEKRLLYLFAALIMSASLFLSASRGGILTFVCQLVFLGFLLSLAERKRVFSLRNLSFVSIILVLVCLVVVWLGAEPIMNRITELSDPQGVSGSLNRLTIWRDTLGIVKDFPIVGTGLGTFPFVYPVYKSQKNDLAYREAHNDYLQALSETGMIGAILLLLLGSFAVVRAVRLLKSEHNKERLALRIGVLTGCFGILVHSITDFNLQIPSNALLFFVLGSIALLPMQNKASLKV